MNNELSAHRSLLLFFMARALRWELTQAMAPNQLSVEPQKELCQWSLHLSNLDSSAPVIAVPQMHCQSNNFLLTRDLLRRRH
jgi:hypothetical protein